MRPTRHCALPVGLTLPHPNPRVRAPPPFSPIPSRPCSSPAGHLLRDSLHLPRLDSSDQARLLVITTTSPSLLCRPPQPLPARAAPVRRLLVGRCRGTSPSRLDKPQGDKATALTGAIPNACRSSCPTRTSLCLSISVRALSPRRRPRRPSAPVAISTRPFVSNHPEACAYLRLCHNVYQTPSPTCFFSISRRHPVPIYPHCGYRRWPHPTSLSNKSKRRP
jgi:hypothetical protein